MQDLQQVARANLIFGLHVHVGIPDRVSGIQVMNQARYFLPHLLALSANSPFWLGRDTGFRGYRLKVFERFPRTGIPDAFESISEYDDYLKLLVKTTCIDNAKKIWWDIRLHPFFNTLEFRICDAQSRVDDTIALAALMQAIICKLYKLQRQNLTFRVYRRRLIDENRWRACRYGLDGSLIDFGRESEIEERSLLHEMLDFISTEVDELGSGKAAAHIEKIIHGRERCRPPARRLEEIRRKPSGAVVDHITGGDLREPSRQGAALIHAATGDGPGRDGRTSPKVGSPLRGDPNFAWLTVPVVGLSCRETFGSPRRGDPTLIERR